MSLTPNPQSPPNSSTRRRYDPPPSRQPEGGTIEVPVTHAGWLDSHSFRGSALTRGAPRGCGSTERVRIQTGAERGLEVPRLVLKDSYPFRGSALLLGLQKECESTKECGFPEPCELCGPVWPWGLLSEVRRTRAVGRIRTVLELVARSLGTGVGIAREATCTSTPSTPNHRRMVFGGWTVRTNRIASRVDAGSVLVGGPGCEERDRSVINFPGYGGGVSLGRFAPWEPDNRSESISSQRTGACRCGYGRALLLQDIGMIRLKAEER